MNQEYTIAETFTLPSKGLIYDRPINPEIKLRAMTTREEMKRLAPSETPYKVMCEIIQDCIVGDAPAIPVYDMCLGDYQFLLHKLRIVTYGSQYKMSMLCMNCGSQSEIIADLDNLEVFEYTDDIKNLMDIELPVSKRKVHLSVQTPRMLDEVNIRNKELKQKTGIDYSYLLTIQHLIEKIDDKYINPIQAEKIASEMTMRDANKIIQTADQINRKVGLGNEILVECGQCGYKAVTTFRITTEFFGPTID